MGRKEAAALRELRGTDAGPAVKNLFRSRWPFGVKGIAIAATVLVLLGVVAFGVTREATTPRHESSPARLTPTTPPKPAFTRGEEAYIQALWPIHGDVERSAIRMSLGKIFYKTNDLGKADLKTRVDASLAVFQRAEERISALQPPPSLAREHENYLAAVRLFAQSTVEVLKMFDDGNDEHLLAAYPLSKEGSDKIREIGAKFWEDEFTPH